MWFGFQLLQQVRERSNLSAVKANQETAIQKVEKIRLQFQMCLFGLLRTIQQRVRKIRARHEANTTRGGIRSQTDKHDSKCWCRRPTSSPIKGTLGQEWSSTSCKNAASASRHRPSRQRSWKPNRPSSERQFVHLLQVCEFFHAGTHSVSPEPLGRLP